MVPLNSWPSTFGGIWGNRPCVMWTSVPQTAAVSTLTMVSPGPGTGSGKSSMANSVPPCHTTAFMSLLLCLILSLFESAP